MAFELRGNRAASGRSFHGQMPAQPWRAEAANQINRLGRESSAARPCLFAAGAQTVTFARSQSSGPIALLGYSMGAAVVIEEAAHDPRVAAVIEDSGFDTLANAFNVHFHNMTLLPAVPFDQLVTAIGQLDLKLNIAQVRPVDSARLVTVPTLAIIGTADKTVPPSEGFALFNALGGPKQLLVVPGAGHVGGYANANSLYERTVLSFLTIHLS